MEYAGHLYHVGFTKDFRHIDILAGRSTSSRKTSGLFVLFSFTHRSIIPSFPLSPSFPLRFQGCRYGVFEGCAVLSYGLSTNLISEGASAPVTYTSLRENDALQVNLACMDLHILWSVSRPGSLLDGCYKPLTHHLYYRHLA